MSQTDEILNNLTDDEIAEYSVDPVTEEHIVVGADRFITVPESLKRIAVQGDHNIETVTFDCPRYWDGIDMSGMEVYINYARSDKTFGSYQPKVITVDETDETIMHFDWTISRNVTKAAGNLIFLVCIKKTDEVGELINHWNSEPCMEMYVSAGLNCVDPIPEHYLDEIADLLLRMETNEARLTAAMDKYEKINFQMGSMEVLLRKEDFVQGTFVKETGIADSKYSIVLNNPIPVRVGDKISIQPNGFYVHSKIIDTDDLSKAVVLRAFDAKASDLAHVCEQDGYYICTVSNPEGSRITVDQYTSTVIRIRDNRIEKLEEKTADLEVGVTLLKDTLGLSAPKCLQKDDFITLKVDSRHYIYAITPIKNGDRISIDPNGFNVDFAIIDNEDYNLSNYLYESATYSDCIEYISEYDGYLMCRVFKSDFSPITTDDYNCTIMVKGPDRIDKAVGKITYKMELCTSENLCNPDEVTENAYMSAAGVVIGSSSYSYTGLMPVTEGDVLKFPFIGNDGTIKSGSVRHICAFDEVGKVVESAGVSESTYTYTVPATIKGIIVSFQTAYNDFMVLKNYEGLPSEKIKYFTPYYVATEEFLNGVSYSKKEVDDMFAEHSSGTADTTNSEITHYMTRKTSENLCNPDEETTGLMDVTGIAKPNNTTYKHTGKIAVSEGDVLTFYRNASGTAVEAQVHRVCAYDSTGTAVSEAGSATKVYSYTVPEGITSVVVSCYADYTGFMVLKNYEGHPPAAIPYAPPAYVATEGFLKGAVTWDVLDEEIKDKVIAYNPIETDYINAEIDRVKRETLRNDGVLNFIFSTDQHIRVDLGEIHTIQEIARVADIGQFDFVCMGGDMIQAGDTSWYSKEENGVLVQDIFVDKKDSVISNLSDIARELVDVKCPVFYCLGNHDVCFGAYHGARNRNAYFGYTAGDPEYKDPNAQSLLPREFFRIMNNKLGETVVWDDDNPQCGYFYKDFARSKIRVVVLNSQDVFKDDGTVVNTVEDTSLHPLIQQKQLTWICDKALNFMDKGEERSEWAVIFFSHANVLLGGASGGSVGNEVCVLLRGVLNAFMTGGTYSGTTSADYQYDFSVNVDFTQQGPVDFICSINGHVHADTVLNIGDTIDNYTGYDEPAIDRPCIQVSSANGTLDSKDYSGSALKDYFILPERTEGTITTECFDIFSIDRNARKIKTIRFGAGEDREISY